MAHNVILSSVYYFGFLFSFVLVCYLVKKRGVSVFGWVVFGGPGWFINIYKYLCCLRFVLLVLVYILYLYTSIFYTKVYMGLVTIFS